MGHIATHAVVLARLVTLGRDHGIHPFIVQIRSLEDHTPLPGKGFWSELCYSLCVDVVTFLCCVVTTHAAKGIRGCAMSAELMCNCHISCVMVREGGVVRERGGVARCSQRLVPRMSAVKRMPVLASNVATHGSLHLTLWCYALQASR